MYGTRYERWVSRTEWPLTISSLLFLAAFATTTLADRGTVLQVVASIVFWATWVAFIVDYVVRLAIAQPRRRWFFRHLLDLAVVVLPMLRLLQLVRLVTAVAKVGRGAGNALRGRVVIYTLAATGLVLLAAALAIYSAEAGRGGPIDSFGEAVWWALVTVTTVGYGDYTPVTVAGRMIAAGLMIGGVALIGSATATISSWIVEKVALRDEDEDEAAAHHVAALRVEIAELKALVRERRAE